jgi:hypothetical protein
MRGHQIVPEGNASQREAISVVWSLDIGGEDPWRVPSPASEPPAPVSVIGIDEFRQISGRI